MTCGCFKKTDTHLLLYKVANVFSKKTTKIDEIFTVELTHSQMDGEDFANFCGLLRKHELQKKKERGSCVLLVQKR